MAGFPAAYVTGAGSSLSNFGLPDLGLVTQGDMADQVRRLTEATSLPLIVDGDTGFGNAVNVVRTVRRYEHAGAAAIQIEDQSFPKRCGHLTGKQLISATEFATKVTAAVEARTDDRFLIIARTDAIEALGFEEAIDRANRYAEAGADLVFVESPTTVHHIERIVKEIDAPLMINMISHSVTPVVSQERLASLGFAIAIYPMVTMASAMEGMRRALEALQADGDDRAVAHLFDPESLMEIFDLAGWTELSERYA